MFSWPRFLFALSVGLLCHFAILYFSARGSDGSNATAIFIVYLLPGMMFCDVIGVHTIGGVLVTTAVIYVPSWTLVWFVFLTAIRVLRRQHTASAPPDRAAPRI